MNSMRWAVLILLSFGFVSLIFGALCWLTKGMDANDYDRSEEGGRDF